MAEKTYKLVMQHGPQPGQTFSLSTRTVTIGRDPMADIVISDPEVSRQHVRLTRSEEGYHIQDLGSTNGSFVNGQRLTGDSQPLRPGQEILLGSSIMLLYQESSESASDLLVMPIEEASAPDAFPFADEADEVDEAEADEALDLYNQQDDVAVPDLVASTVSESEPDLIARPVTAVPSSPQYPSAPLRSPAAPLVPGNLNAPEKKRSRTVTWVIVGSLLLILCCCAFVLSAWYVWGDPLMHALGVY